MKQRLFWTAFSGTACILGAFLYGLYRPTTYIGRTLGDLLSLPLVPHHIFSNMLAFYVPDFLWAFSLTTALFAVFLPHFRESVVLGGMVTAYGILWELGQCLGILKGTADMWDIFMYVTAVLMTVFINILYIRRRNVL